MSRKVPLSAKLFINGFEKPSYVVFSIRLSPALDRGRLEAALEQLVRAHPLLRSLVVLGPAGVPMRFAPGSVDAWMTTSLVVRVGDDDDDIERRLLETPMPPWLAFPFRVEAVSSSDGTSTRIITKAHHAIIDAAYGRRLVRDFFGALACHDVPPVEDPPAAHLKLRAWLRGARFARIPEVSLLTNFSPCIATERHPIAVTTASLPIDPRVVGKTRSLTSPETVASELFATMGAYNQTLAPTNAPERIQMMVAMARPRERGAQRRQSAGYTADTRLVEVDTSAPQSVRDDSVRRQMRGRRATNHDLALGAFYAMRRARALVPWPRRTPRHIPAIHFTFSDLTGTATRFDRARIDGHEITEPRLLVSPVALAHAGLIAFKWRGETRVVLIHHAGALDGRAFMDAFVGRFQGARSTCR